MFGSTVPSGDAAAAHIGDEVEVVPGDRVRPRALYRGQKFRLMSVDATRYRWQCSVSTCPSRLMTDKFGERHVLYSFKDHDEKEHLAMEERKRSSNKTYKSEVVEKIGEFMYVLERTTINIKCWRCQYVRCSGRCRTSLDGKTLLHGPTPHTCKAHAPPKEKNARSLHDRPLSSEHAPAALSQSLSSTSTDACVEQMQRQHMEVAGDNEESCGSQEQRSTPAQPPRESAVRIDSSESDADDDGMDDEESSKRGGHEEGEVPLQRLLYTGGGCSNAAGSIGRTASVVEVLEMLSGSCACAENKLLAVIYEQVFALLHKEEKLLEVQMRNEVRRGRLLDLLMRNGPSESGSNSNPPEGLYSVD
ncbi:hypothetical protein MTO96_024993 [Rhipicephalus appendiculatus]